MKRMVSNGGIFIPFNLKKNIIPIFHLDNIYWLEDTPNDKNMSHALQLSVIQPCVNEKCEPIVLNLENTQSLTLIDNPFNQLLDRDTPTKEMTHRPHGCQQFCKPKPHNFSRSTIAFI